MMKKAPRGYTVLTNRFLCTCLFSTILVSPVEAQGPGLLGDVDGDGQVTLQDAEAIANFLVGNLKTLPRPENADVNQDGRVSVRDAMFIAQFVKGISKLDRFPPEVLAVKPRGGAKEVPPSAVIHIFFSEAISTAAALSAISFLDVTASTLIPGVLSFAEGSVLASFTPEGLLPLNHAFQVKVSTALKDLAGNSLRSPFLSTFDTAGEGTLRVEFGDRQRVTINSVLPKPLIVRVLSPSGIPQEDVPVAFQVDIGNGVFLPSGLRTIEVVSDAEGLAQAIWKIGGQVGVDNTVLVTAPGFSSATFSASLLAAEARNLRIVSGNNQNCPTGATTPLPLVVKATDEGGNAVQGVQVTFNLLKGEGNFQGSPTATRITDSSGTASTFFTHGTSSGITEIETSFDGMVGQAPIFTLLALIPQPTRPTAIVGTVINTSNEPLPRIKVFLASDSTIRTLTDSVGFFRLQPVPTGMQRFVIDALTSPAIDGVVYADLAFDLSVVQGQDNTIQMPAILPPIDPESVLDVSDVKGGTLTLRANPLWKLVVNPGQANFHTPTNPNTGRLLVTIVPPDKIPMPPPEGKFARFFVAIEPAHVRFDPPAQVTFPNADNLAPGTITDIFSFDHNTGMFEPIGFGQVDEDGQAITSLPGSGLVHGGWHLAPSPIPIITTWLEGFLPGPIRDACTLSQFGVTAAVAAAAGGVNVLLCNIPAQGITSAAFDCPIPESPCGKRTTGYGVIAEDLKEKGDNRKFFGELLNCVSSKICQFTPTEELKLDQNNLMDMNRLLFEDWKAAITSPTPPSQYEKAFKACVTLKDVKCATELVKAHIGPDGTLGKLLDPNQPGGPKLGCGTGQEWRRVINAQIGCGLRILPAGVERNGFIETFMQTTLPFEQILGALGKNPECLSFP